MAVGVDTVAVGDVDGEEDTVTAEASADGAVTEDGAGEAGPIGVDKTFR
jgi:hypothetical protein